MKTVREVEWLLEYVADIESDMSVFHRVDDMYVLPTSIFFSRAVRLAAYDGAVRARMRTEQEQAEVRVLQAPQAEAPSSSNGAIPEVDFSQAKAMRDAQRQARWAQFGTIERVTDEQMVAMLR